VHSLQAGGNRIADSRAACMHARSVHAQSMGARINSTTARTWMMGQHCDWMGEGVANSRVACSILAGSPVCSNLGSGLKAIGSAAPSPSTTVARASRSAAT